MNKISTIYVRATHNSKSNAIMRVAGNSYQCKIGKNGIGAKRIEGDNVTPRGIFRLVGGFYRADRIRKPLSKLHLTPIKLTDGWCDDPQSPRYNQLITRPFLRSHEKLWRDDKLYDVIIVVDYNVFPRKRNAGSAIFLHLKNEETTATQGCVALSNADMLKVLRQIDSDTLINIS